MSVVGRAALTPKHSMALVRLGRRFVLVGISADRMSALSEITDPEEVAELAARTTNTAVSKASREFDDLLQREAGDYRDTFEESPPASRPAASPVAGVIAPLSDLLNRLRALQSKGG
jgi:hypothetical protein